MCEYKTESKFAYDKDIRIRRRRRKNRERQKNIVESKEFVLVNHEHKQHALNCVSTKEVFQFYREIFFIYSCTMSRNIYALYFILHCLYICREKGMLNKKKTQKYIIYEYGYGDCDGDGDGDHTKTTGFGFTAAIIVIIVIGGV